MWKSRLNHAIQEVRFVIKSTPEHHGVLNFCLTKLPQLRQLNQNTFFSFTELTPDYPTKSACHILYGDITSSGEEILTAGLSSADFEKILKEKVEHGLTLIRKHNPKTITNDDRDIPLEVVEARKYVAYMDDTF